MFSYFPITRGHILFWQHRIFWGKSAKSVPRSSFYRRPIFTYGGGGLFSENWGLMALRPCVLWALQGYPNKFCFGECFLSCYPAPTPPYLITPLPDKGLWILSWPTIISDNRFQTCFSKTVHKLCFTILPVKQYFRRWQIVTSLLIANFMCILQNKLI